ncbi:MAG: hypothetical protein KC708_01555 [Anaerolineae bacterium]|nr:hypothetical protein [Anaerolineae bacterium]
MLLVMILLILTLIIPPTQAQNEEGNIVHRQTVYTALTYHQPTGNRFVEGMGTFPDVRSIDYRLPGMPIWLLLTPEDPLLVHVILEDGSHWRLSDVVEQSRRIPSTAPMTTDTSFALLANPADAAAFTHPIVLGDDQIAYVNQNGDLVLSRRDTVLDQLALGIQPDARLVINDIGQIAVYAAGTNQRYVHGIMGDDVEGTALVVVEVVEDRLQIISRVDLLDDNIYEGLSPMWADVDGDSIQDLITTVSNGGDGARNRVYLFDGGTLTREIDGTIIGRPNRWQHQLAWGPFGVDGEMLLVDVLTPHIGGIVRFHRYTGSSLEVVAEIGGHTSHVIGSRNLDMAVAGDFNGDGRPEIVLPTQDRTQLDGIQLTENGPQVMWSLPLEGQLSTNLSALSANGRPLALVAGMADGRIRVWFP